MMVEKRSAPKLRIEDDAPEATSGFAGDEGGVHVQSSTPDSKRTSAQVSGEASAEGGGAVERPKRGFSHAMRSLRQWLTETFPGHENAVLFGFLGFVLAVLIFIIGFWRTLFIALVVLLGVAVGQQFDGDPKIFNAIRNLVRENRG